jgi:hypothetical protein
MYRAIAVVLCLMVLAAPCVYDLTSNEPSPVGAALTAVGQLTWP